MKNDAKLGVVLKDNMYVKEIPFRISGLNYFLNYSAMLYNII